MRGVSAGSLAEVVRLLEAALEGGADAAQLGTDLFAVAVLLDAQPALRRAITDPSTPPEARARVVSSVLEGKLSEPAVELSAAAAAERWSATRDLADSLEHAGVIAQVSAAEDAGQGDELEDELFRFGRVVVGNAELRDVLTDRSAPVQGKQSLVTTLMEGKASAPSVRLAEQAVAGRHRSFEAALQEFTKVVADRRERFVATVHTAQQLSDADKGRLAAAIAREYGRNVQLNEVIDPDVLGGLRVEIGDTVIDGTVASKLDDARRRLTG
ncbi:MAG: F0F1 ATP synthase subunit delta [Propionibacteriales bacterium]|nr:F0F1 ATP synthase subunit delta [Propionibacteriales bacterium]